MRSTEEGGGSIEAKEVREAKKDRHHVSRRMFRLWVLGRDYRVKVLYIGHRMADRSTRRRCRPDRRSVNEGDVVMTEEGGRMRLRRRGVQSTEEGEGSIMDVSL